MWSLTYIHHSCFLLRVEGVGSFLFDYWKPDGRNFMRGDSEMSWPGFLDSVDADLPFYVFVSHHHKDHYNTAVFGWRVRFRNIHYILSNDTARFSRHLIKELPEGMVSVVRPADSLDFGNMWLRAFGSTDTGVSYGLGVKVSGEQLTIFHAGDLNSWLWLDESTEAEIKDMRRRFGDILESVAEVFPAFDVAMFPVDSRLGVGYEEGASRFVHRISVKHFFPMHFALGESPEEVEERKRAARRFDLYAARGGDYIALQAPGDCFAHSE